jgi:hypothetical protein
MGRKSTGKKNGGTGRTPTIPRYTPRPMHYDAHQPVIDELEARINTLRDSL